MNARSGSQTPALILATLAFAMCFAVWGLIAPLVPQFREIYHLSVFESSLLVAVPVLLGSVARIPIGMLTDRYGGRIIFTLLMLFLIIPVVFIGFSGSYLMLVF